MKASARPSAGQTALRFPKLKEKGTTVEPPTKKVRKSRCTTAVNVRPQNLRSRMLKRVGAPKARNA
jgi:hypothetical protein